MKCLKLRLLTILIALLMAFGGMSVMVSATENRVIRVGYSANYGVFSDNSTDNPSGYGYEYLMKISNYTGWSYEFISVGWSEGLQLLEEGKLDIFGPLQKTPERELIFDFPRIEMGFEHGALYALNEDNRFYYNDVASFDGMTVGSDEGNYYLAPLQKYCDDNGISVNIVHAQLSEAMLGLENAQYDAFLSGALLDIPGTTVIAKICTEPYYYATSKGNTEVLNALNMALEKIRSEDAYYAAKLDKKYFGGESINTPSFTREEMQFVKDYPTLTVACDPSWAPLEYYDNSKHEYRGVNIDLLTEIGRLSGLNFEFVRTETYEDSKALARSGDVDLLLGYTNPASTNYRMRYSDSIMDIPVMLVARDSIDLSKPIKVSVRAQNPALSQELKRQYPHFNYVDCAGSDEVMSALVKREVDAAFLTTYVYDEFARKQSLDKYISIPTTVSFEQSIGVSKKLPSVALDVINKAIHRISPDQMNTLVFSNTVERAYNIPLSLIVSQNSFAIIATLILLFLAFFYISKRNQKALENVAYVDSLTGASTLTRFRLDVQAALKNASPNEYILVALDIDDFKFINDSFGYETGNKILIAVAEIFKKRLSTGELLGRTVADNFVFLIRCSTTQELNERSNSISDISKSIEGILPEHYSVTFSVGSYSIADPAEDFSMMHDKANFARKSVKGNRTVSLKEYTEAMDKQMEWKKEVTISMELALKNCEFEVFLQPKYLLKDETLTGAEALIRWRHPELGLLPPLMFISIFEQNGFIRKLDMYVFEQVCMLLRRWEDSNCGADHLIISVNLSRMHLYNPLLVGELLELTTKYGVSPRRIEIELTESIVFHNTKLLIDIMNQLRSSGFTISIDDFGSGYSSLNLLKNLPVDVLKIDKGFLGDSTDVSNGRVIIDSVTKMAKSLNLITVAEGVETKEQAEMLLGMGCDIAQGYYYSMPLPIEDFEKLM